MKSEIQTGIVGCGVIGPVHAECYQQIPGLRLTWACDLKPERAAAMARKYGIPKTTTSVAEMLADPSLDAVSICTDHASHAGLAEAALRAGKHVLCEKALASHPESLRRLRQVAAERPDLVAAGVLQHRFDEVYRYVRKSILEGKFGRMLTASLHVLCFRGREYYLSDPWRGTWAEEGGSLMINQAIHFVDTLQWVMGGVEAVCGAWANLGHEGVIETEDTASACLRFRSGALGSVTATSCSHLGWEPTLQFTGTEGTLELRNAQLHRIDFRDKELESLLEREIRGLREAESVGAAKVYYGTSHPVQLLDFVAAIREGRPPFVSFADACEPVEIVLALYRSQGSGSWVDLGRA